jgi:imidazolonepropionase-like amidohydrolase
MLELVSASRLITGLSGDAPLESPVIAVRNGQIDGIYQGHAPANLADEAARVLDYPGCTLLPGLVDSHVHLSLPGDGTPFEDRMQESDGVLVAGAAFAGQVALDVGVTTARDCGARGDTAFALRRTLQLGYGRSPRLILCGQPITITGGHCWYMGGEADGEDSLRRKVRQLAKDGADFIKVLGSGGGTPHTKPWEPSFHREELVAVVDEAHRMGRKITIHCTCARAMELATEAGTDQIEHASFVLDESGRREYVPAVAEQLAQADVVVTSTLSWCEYLVKAMRARPDRSRAEQEMLDRGESSLEGNLTDMAKLHAAGVRIVAGTDAGWRYTPFDALPAEMALMEQCGLSAMEVIVAATGAAAVAIGIDDHVGMIREGLDADIIAVEGDPLLDMRALRELRLVMQQGRAQYEG